MAFFTDLFNFKNHVPSWASFLSKEEYTAFINEVHISLNGFALDYKIKNGFIYLNNDKNNTLGLFNLAKECKQSDPQDYRKVIESHFENLFKSHEFKLEFNKIINYFEKVKQYIGIKICSYEDIEVLEASKKIDKEICRHVHALIIFDLPYTISSVGKSFLEIWNKTPEELFVLGKKNILEKYNFTFETLTDGGVLSHALEGNTLFEANAILYLENRQDLLGKKGAYIIVPNQNIVVIYPVNEESEVDSVSNFVRIVLANILKSNAPNPISRDLYWYADGKLVNVDYPWELGDVRHHLVTTN